MSRFLHAALALGLGVVASGCAMLEPTLPEAQPAIPAQ